VWGDTRIALPADLGPDVFENVLTGERLEAGEEEGERRLAAGALFTHFPVVLLRGAARPGAT
jgi:hypothetical protein